MSFISLTSSFTLLLFLLLHHLHLHTLHHELYILHSQWVSIDLFRRPASCPLDRQFYRLLHILTPSSTLLDLWLYLRHCLAWSSASSDYRKSQEQVGRRSITRISCQLVSWRLHKLCRLAAHWPNAFPDCSRGILSLCRSGAHWSVLLLHQAPKASSHAQVT